VEYGAEDLADCSRLHIDLQAARASRPVGNCLRQKHISIVIRQQGA